MLLNVQTSPGEFLDKLTILEIKSERMTDPSKLANVTRELTILRETWGASPLSARDVSALVAALKQVNEALWEIEDLIRDREAAQQFDARFVALARSVYTTNDERAAIKKRINIALGSRIIEEKAYKPYR